jgi:Peptidase family M28
MTPLTGKMLLAFFGIDRIHALRSNSAAPSLVLKRIGLPVKGGAAGSRPRAYSIVMIAFRFSACVLLGSAVFAAHAQSRLSSPDAGHRDLDAIGGPIRPMPADPAIAHAIAQVSPAQIQHTIAALVSFHNRSTLSSLDKDLPPNTGVLAAADWIEAQFRAISAACDGCLEVHRDSFIQPPLAGPNPRVTQPTPLNNIYAILRGSDPAQASRMILVTGHYDSRDSTNEDTHGEAPGANDDASGTAVSLECARVLSKVRLPGTLVFVAVAGEEQGLLGSKHLADLAKKEGWQLEGVLNNDIVGGNRTPGDKFQDPHAVRVFSENVPANAPPEEIRRILALGYESDSPSRELSRAIADVSRTYTAAPATNSLDPVLEFRRDRFLRGGDHSSFNQDGFAAVRGRRPARRPAEVRRFRLHRPRCAAERRHDGRAGQRAACSGQRAVSAAAPGFHDRAERYRDHVGAGPGHAGGNKIRDRLASPGCARLDAGDSGRKAGVAARRKILGNGWQLCHHDPCLEGQRHLWSAGRGCKGASQPGGGAVAGTETGEGGVGQPHELSATSAAPIFAVTRSR